jgi:preprotein translocase subunit SecY
MGVGVYMIQGDLAVCDTTTFFGKSLFLFTISVSITTGTCFIMWLGEKITEHGIGNGISMIIAAGIVASYWNDVMLGINDVKNGAMSPFWLIGVPVLYVFVTVLIIMMQQASRKIPIQYARRTVGRREMAGASNYLPLKINTAGVIPVIFASSILMFPGMILSLFSGTENQSFLAGMKDWFAPSTVQHSLYAILGMERGGLLNLFKMGNLYNFLYILFTVFFCYFYTAITFNPVDTADNLKRVGAFIPGRRPGRNTSDYIDYVLTRITFVGSLFLVVVAMIPNLLTVSFNINGNFANMVGGTGLIIVAGVFLDLMKQIESQLLMRHYEGFKYRSHGVGSARMPGRPITASRTLNANRAEGGRR